MLHRRLSINSNLFNRSPVAAIKQILGQSAKLVSYKVNSVISWSGDVFVDVEYNTIPIDQFSVYWIKISEIKHLIPNSEKYVTTINDCSVKLNNPRLNMFKEYLPIRIKRTIVNDTDAYDNYYSLVNEQTTVSNNEQQTNEYRLKTNINQPNASYFGTTVLYPMNSLITPINLIVANNDNNNSSNQSSTTNCSLGFEITIPPKLYPDSFKPKIEYTMDDTLRHYKQLLTNSRILSLAETIIDKTNESATNEDIFKSNIASTTCYLIHSSQLPNHAINGIIALQPKRIPDILLYYPTNSYTISVQELDSIKQFIEMDTINYYNFLSQKQ